MLPALHPRPVLSALAAAGLVACAAAAQVVPTPESHLGRPVGADFQLADWGEVNLSEGATLRRFVETVRQSFPARRYGLVIGDHAAAWPGVPRIPSRH